MKISPVMVAPTAQIDPSTLERARAAVRRQQGLAGLISLNSSRRHG